MKVRDLITFDCGTNAGSTGYDTFLVKLEKLALVDVSRTPSPSGLYGAPGTKRFTLQAIEAGRAEVQFARFRPWLVPAEVLYEEVLPIDVKAAEADEAGGVEAAAANIKPGGWTPFAKVSADAQKVFDEAVKGLLGVDYTPLAVTSQVVNGVNYIFAANGKIVYPGSREYPALLRVFSPPGGPARAVNIQRLGVPGALGAFGPFHETTGEEKAVLQKALSGLVGAGYEALLTSVQVVNGFNFQFIGTQTLAAASGDKYPVAFTVYQPPSGSPVFTGAQKAYDLV